MPKVALVETKPSRTNFKREFEGAFEFDQYQLCSNPDLKKVLKRDCDIDMNPDDYDWVILVGSDALKYYTKEIELSPEYGVGYRNRAFLYYNDSFEIIYSLNYLKSNHFNATQQALTNLSEQDQPASIWLRKIK